MKEKAELQREWIQDPELKEEWLRDPELQQESLRQDNIIFGGLIVIGTYLVQPFITATSLDLSAKVCVISFSIAIPLLSALVLVNQQETFRRRRSKSFPVTVSKVVAQSCAFVGLVAGFWHMLWIAGVGILVSAVVGVAVHSSGYWRLEQDQMPRYPRGDKSADTGT